MKVSFIVPLYNCLALTRAMTASLQASLPPGLVHEIILVDDGSTDGTRDWLPGLREPFRVVLNERNLGYGAANNRGAALASGEILVLLNNDLLFRPGWLEPMLAAHRSLGAKAGLVGNVQRDAATGKVDHAGLFINHKGKPQHLRRLPWAPLRFVVPVRRRVAVTGACALIGAAVWKELGGFEEAYVNGCEDVDLALRLRAAGRVNAVALRSEVLHHVSASPGRKLRDEENTRRLAARWRAELARLGQYDWTRHVFAALIPDPRDFADSLLAWHMALYLLHLRRAPPPTALPGMDTALDVEFARWDALLGVAQPRNGH